MELIVFIEEIQTIISGVNNIQFSAKIILNNNSEENQHLLMSQLQIISQCFNILNVLLIVFISFVPELLDCYCGAVKMTKLS